MAQNPPRASIIEDLEDLYENAPCGYLSLDPAGRIFKVNKTLCNWVGYASEDLLGKRYAGVIHCDRAKMYWRFGRLQWCWAHMKRDVQSLIDSPCHTRKRLGHDLMRHGLEPGPLYKRLLEAAREAQLEGTITTTAQALELVDRLLAEEKNRQTLPPEGG